MNGTGPQGQGAMTGRGLGPCGRGLGFRRGMGFSRGFYGRQVITEKQEKAILEDELEALKQEIQDTEKRLKELKS